MRKDSLGFFWRDEPVIREKKEVHKVVPPNPIWLNDNYLPYYTEAIDFYENARSDGRALSDAELIDLANPLNEKKAELICDTEVYCNYFLAAFKHAPTGKVVWVEKTDAGWDYAESRTKLQWLLENFTIVTFNGNGYDLPMLALALADCSAQAIKNASDEIIVVGDPAWRVLQSRKAKPLKIDHIDLIEVAPLRGGLKTYSGRIHCRRMQDLPFAPEKLLTTDQIHVTRYYCCNDLDNTGDMLTTLREQITLREQVGKLYGIDLRSRSDAQIAEDVFKVEVGKLNGMRCTKTIVAPGTTFYYQVPAFMHFQTDALRWVLNGIRNTPFVVAHHGSFDKPKNLEELQFTIGDTKYRMGNGGLHSCEHKVSYVSDDEYQLHDFDVTSYYPRAIINQRLYPKHLGPSFLVAFEGKVNERILAKQIKDVVKANGFKIVVNGGFGKLGSKHSILYSPDLLLQVTLTGQLSLLMLIEVLELNSISVVSANTDGVVVRCKRSQQELLYKCIKWWEGVTHFDMEETRYTGIYSRDVNNYFAVKQKQDKDGNWLNEPDSVKTKGTYANPWSQEKDKSQWMHKNPQRTICIDAVCELLVHGTPIVTTIKGCRDIRKFVSVQNVSGGAVKVWGGDDIQYLGKTVRWYYGAGVEEPLIYAKTGKKVPRSNGAVPCMTFPEEFPSDIDFDWYINEAERILTDIAYA